MPAVISYTVNSAGDLPDPLPGDGDVRDTAGLISLRSVMMELNASGNPANTYQIEFANVLGQMYFDKFGNPVAPMPNNTMTVELRSQLPAVPAGRDYVIAGSTTRRVTITRDLTVNPNDKFRFLDVMQGGHLELHGVKLTKADNVAGGVGFGGAVRNNAGAGLNVVNCYFKDNLADEGGAIGNQGTLTVAGWPATGAKTEFVHNGATGVGGAINNGAVVAGGPQCSVVITDAKFDDNVAGDLVLWKGAGKGGAIGHHTAGLVWVFESEFLNNKARDGGAIYADGAAVPPVNVRVEYSNFDGNKAEGAAPSNGGAVWIQGLGADFKGCDFDNNSAVDEGGAMYQVGGSLLLDACTFGNNNTAGGIWGSNDVGNVVGPGNPSTVFRINGTNGWLIWW